MSLSTGYVLDIFISPDYTRCAYIYIAECTVMTVLTGIDVGKAYIGMP